MADDKHYVPGDFYRIDDRTGYKIRAKVSRKEWTSLIVHKDRWEPRQPQDFVKGVIDDQTVPDPRPRSTDVFLFSITTTLTANSGAGSNVITVASIVGLNVGDTIQIMLDTNEFFTTTIMQFGLTGVVPAPSDNLIYFQNVFSFQIPGIVKTSFSPDSIILNKPLPYSASSGNIVQDLTDYTNITPGGYPNDLS